MLIVQCDFDDTITVGNVSVALRESFGPENWREMENDYEAGALSVEQSNIRQFGLMIATRHELEGFVRSNVVVRYGFREFANYCQNENVRLVIVSSGLDIYVNTTLASLGLDHLEIHAGETCVTPRGLRVSYSDLTGTELIEGFKDAYVSHFKAQGHTVVYIGDGVSDYIPAALADYVFARGRLADHMEAHGAPHYRFDSFAEVSQHIKEIRQKLV